MTFRRRNSSACSATRKHPPCSHPSWQCLQNTLLSPHDTASREQLSEAFETLQDYLRLYRREVGLPDGAEIQMDLVYDNAIRWSTLHQYFEQVGNFEQFTGDSCPDDSIKILVCRVMIYFSALDLRER